MQQMPEILSLSSAEPPGREVQRLLENRAISQSDFAEIIGYSMKQVSLILNGVAPLTMDFALRLERTIGGSAEEWIQKETAYRLGIEKAKQEKELRQILIRNDVYSRMPIREMVKLGWIPDPGRDTDKLVSIVKSFWNMRTWDFSFMDKSPAMLMRSSDAYQARFNPCYAATWLHMAQRRAAEKKPSASFDSSGVRQLGFALPSFSTRSDGEAAIADRLESLGVTVLELPHLPQTYLDGAAFSSGRHPVVAFTRRLDRVDNFWFVLAHELAHVCLHLGKSSGDAPIFVDCEDRAGNRQEEEADTLAGEFLGHREIRAFFARRRISREAVLGYAGEYNIHPGIVVGYLQHIRFLTYYNFNDLKSRTSASAGGKAVAPKPDSGNAGGERRASRVR